MVRLTRSSQLASFAFILIASLPTLATQSFADQNCADDIKRLSEKRQVELDRVNNLVKEAKGKPLDPAKFCSQSAGLNTSENALITYMEKNKDWCGVPDEIIAGLKANHTKSLGFSAKACAVAAQQKKQQAAGAAQGPALPAGPL